MAIDWSTIRAQFPALERWTFLNTATYGQTPRASLDAISRHFRRRDQFACADFLEWFDDMDRVRAKIAKLIHCAPDDIGFSPSASAGLAILLSGISWRPGCEILTLRGEFPNLPYAASTLASSGAALIEAENWDQFCALLSSRTKLVLLSTVNYATGFRPPLAEAARLAHESGALLYLDGTQSIGALRFDAQEIQPDFLSVDGYKWLLCPNGAGFVYAPARTREWLKPNVIGWRSDRGWRNVDHLNHGSPELPDGAERYEGGMIPFPLLYAMEASLDLILSLGEDAIEARVLELAAGAAGRMRNRGAEVAEALTPIVAARFHDRDVSRLAVSLQEQGILVAARHGRLRISPHFYNNEGDLDALARAIS